MLIFRNLFGQLALQLGVILISSLFITLAVCTILINAFSLNGEEPLPWIIMFLFNILMIVIWLLAIMGAYKDSSKIISTATILWTIFLTLWAALVFRSYFSASNTRNICLDTRCPEVLWLLDCSWHELANDLDKIKREPAYDLDKIKNNTVVVPLSTVIPKSPHTKGGGKAKNGKRKTSNKSKKSKSGSTHTPLKQRASGSDQFDDALTTNRSGGGGGPVDIRTAALTQKQQGSLVISIVLTTINCMIFLFSWTILFSYHKELQCLNMCQCKD